MKNLQNDMPDRANSQPVICNNCGFSGHWIQDDESNWRIAGEDGAIHKCTHKDKKVKEQESTDQRPKIHIKSNKLPQMVDDAERIMIEKKAGVYQRNGMLVRVVANPKITHKGIKRDDDGLASIIIAVDSIWLCEELTRHIQWLKEDKRTKSGWKATGCPKIVAETLIARSQWEFPPLAGVINCPTLRWDGSILETPGYDEKSCLLYQPDRKYQPIPTNPTWDHANKAFQNLCDMLRDFPFVDKASKAVAISAIETALVRRSLRVAPAHGFSATKMGTGKTLLSDVAALVATGRTATKISKPDNPDEEKKAFTSLLLEGEPCVCVDNIDDTYKSNTLCTILTETEWSNRILGANKSAKLHTNTFWTFSGNNLLLAGDLADRALLCTMDAGVEKPDERTFAIKEIREYILTHRADIVRDCLTILRAYVAAGKPSQRLKPYNRFPDWSEWVRASIVWASDDSDDAGLWDPCLTREKVKSNDPVRASIGGLLKAWHDAFEKEEPTTIKDIIKASEGKMSTVNAEKAEILADALMEFASDKSGRVNARGVAWKLKKFHGRIEDGYRVKQVATVNRAVLWKVEKV